VLYIAAVCQIRHDTPGRAYYRRKLAEGKTGLEALRCLKGRLSNVVYRQLVADAAAKDAGEATERAAPGGQRGVTTESSAAGPTPTADSSDKPQPGPAARTLPADPAQRRPEHSHGRSAAEEVCVEEVDLVGLPDGHRRIRAARAGPIPNRPITGIDAESQGTRSAGLDVGMPGAGPNTLMVRHINRTGPPARTVAPVT
jgi:hypothetical protein